MSALDMHPTFTNRAGYRAWRAAWKAIQRVQTQRTRQQKLKVKRMQRTNPHAEATARQRKELHFMRVMGRKTMTLLESAKQRMARIDQMERDIADQMASFPLTLACDSIDFHFNKGSLEFPQLPAWTLKAKGKSYYVHHVDFSGTRGSTRETPDHASTKGAIRFRRCTLTLNRDGSATISEAVRVPQAA